MITVIYQNHLLSNPSVGGNFKSTPMVTVNEKHHSFTFGHQSTNQVEPIIRHNMFQRIVYCIKKSQVLVTPNSKF